MLIVRVLQRTGRKNHVDLIDLNQIFEHFVVFWCQGLQNLLTLVLSGLLQFLRTKL